MVSAHKTCAGGMQIMWVECFTSNILSFITPEVYNTEDSNWKEELLGKPVMSKSCFVRFGKTTRRVLVSQARPNPKSGVLGLGLACETRRVFAVHTQLATTQSKRFFHIMLVELWQRHSHTQNWTLL